MAHLDTTSPILVTMRRQRRTKKSRRPHMLVTTEKMSSAILKTSVPREGKDTDGVAEGELIVEYTR